MKATAAVLVAAALAAGCSSHSTRIVPVKPQLVSLSGTWRFAVAGDAHWTRVTVPHTWNVMPAHRDYSGLAWYRRAFTLPVGAEHAHLRLRFDAVFYAARVWLNGRELGRHAGGYTPFELDATRAARRGRNALAVLVDNRRSPGRIPADLTPEWSYDWWNYGGIVRDVALAVTSRAYIAAQRIVATPRAQRVTVTVANASGERLQGTVEARAAGVRAAAPVSVAAGATSRVRLVLHVAHPRLWDFDHPELYELRTTLRRRHAVLDRQRSSFGIRTVELAHGRLRLNGESVRLVGLSRHEDSPAHGLAETPRVVERDYADLKLLGEVMTRPVHYPQSPLVLDYADRHGILLIPEVPAWQLTREQMADPRMRALERRQLRELVESESNHPSVIAWSVGNELDSQTLEGWRFVKEMVRYVHSLDPTRPVGFASNHLYETPQLDATRFCDFVEMNEYFGSWGGPRQGLGPALDAVHRAFPNKPVIVSEFGLEPHWYELGGPPEDSLDSSQYYSVSRIVPATSDLADSERRRAIVDQLAAFRARPWIVGAVYWTYQDYRTATGFVMGAVDMQRRRRGSWHTLRREYSPISLLRYARGRVTIRTRADLPSYTLRGYTLRWRGGSIALPDLPPGSTWTQRLPAPPGKLEVVRPTGFSVATRGG